MNRPIPNGPWHSDPGRCRTGRGLAWEPKIPAEWRGVRRGPGPQGQRAGQADAGGGGQAYGQPRRTDLSVVLGDGRLAVPVVVKAAEPGPVRAGYVAYGQLPLPIPGPVALGRPAAGFPWPWSVYRWIQGEPACLGQVADLAGFAADLAGFLAALYGIDASGGPPPGRHSAFRGGPLTTWDEQTRTAIDLLAQDIDARAAIGVWDRALASSWQQRPVWVHGDVAASNLLLSGGALHAVIDFGCAAAGDPACDLVMAWTFFPGQAAAVFRRRLPFDEATWARARGWALWKALVTLSGAKHGGDGGQAAARRFGWRYSPRQIIGRVIADHSRPIGH